MRVLMLPFAVLAFLAIPALAQAGCAPAHTAEQSTPVTTASSPPQSPAPTKPGTGG
jgi:hypothetical protein